MSRAGASPEVQAEPCPCWLDNYSHTPEVHCCFREGALEDYRPGVPPVCGHWHPDVPRPDAQQTLDFGGAA
jgi:hypothetical protein